MAVSRDQLEAAQAVALQCVENLFGYPVNAVGYWRQFKRSGNLDELQTRLAEMFRGIVADISAANTSLTCDIHDHIAQASAGAGSLPGVKIGELAYVTHHHAAVDLHDRFRLAPVLAIAPESEWLDGEEGEDLEARIRDYAADDRRDFLTRLVEGIRGRGRDCPFDELRSEIAREWNYAVAALPVVPPVVFHSDGLYMAGAMPIRLEGAEADVMQALVELKAATADQLVKRSGDSHAVRDLKSIKNKHPFLGEHIILPTRKGQGGYRTTIVQSGD